MFNTLTKWMVSLLCYAFSFLLILCLVRACKHVQLELFAVHLPCTTSYALYFLPLLYLKTSKFTKMSWNQVCVCVPRTTFSSLYFLPLLKTSKGALTWYGKLTWVSAYAWNLIKLCLLIVWGMAFIFIVHLSFNAIPLLIYDFMHDITTIP